MVLTRAQIYILFSFSILLFFGAVAFYFSGSKDGLVKEQDPWYSEKVLDDSKNIISINELNPEKALDIEDLAEVNDLSVEIIFDKSRSSEADLLADAIKTFNLTYSIKKTVSEIDVNDNIFTLKKPVSRLKEVIIKTLPNVSFSFSEVYLSNDAESDIVIVLGRYE